MYRTSIIHIYCLLNFFSIIQGMDYLDVNTRTQDGKNCLFLTEKPEKLAELLNQGAEVDKIDDSGKTPLYYHYNRLHLYHRAFNSPENQKKFNNIARILLKHGANPNRDRNHPVLQYRNYPLLLDAIDGKNVELVQLLCEYKADTNIVADETTYSFPLHNALATHNLAIIDCVLKHGANPNFLYDYDEYPIHTQLLNCDPIWPIFPAVVTLLLKYKADPNKPYARTDGKKFPLHRAVEINSLELVKALLEHGAKTHYRDQNNCTPLEIARKRGCSQKIIALLTEVTPPTNPTIEDKFETKFDEFVLSVSNIFSQKDVEKAVKFKK